MFWGHQQWVWRVPIEGLNSTRKGGKLFFLLDRLSGLLDRLIEGGGEAEGIFEKGG